MLKITQSNAKLQQHVNRELPDGEAGFIKGRGTRDQQELQKNIYFCFIDYTKAFSSFNKLENF